MIANASRASSFREFDQLSPIKKMPTLPCDAFLLRSPIELAHFLPSIPIIMDFIKIGGRKPIEKSCPVVREDRFLYPLPQCPIMDSMKIEGRNPISLPQIASYYGDSHPFGDLFAASQNQEP